MRDIKEQQGVSGEKLMWVLVFTLVISVMNATTFNVVLPEIRETFQLSTSEVSWVMTGYFVIYAVGTMTYGKMADHYKLKNLLTFGFVLFALGSVMGLAAVGFWMVVAGRMLQAAGAAVIPAASLIIPVRYFPPEKRGRALGMNAVGLALGNALAPVFGGLVAGTVNWRFLFAVPILGLLTLPFYRKYLSQEQSKPGSIDFIGGGLLGGTVALFLLTVTYGEAAFFVFGLALLILFVLRIRFASEPFIRASLFRNKAYSMGLLISFINTGVVIGMPFLTPQMLAQVNRLSPVTIGLIMFPAAAASALMGRKAGMLADERGNPFLVYTASALLFVCFSLLSFVSGMFPLWVMIALILGNLGQTFMQISLSNTISQTLEKEHTGIGMGLFSMNVFVAGAASTAVIGKILDFGTVSFRINPFPGNHRALVFSNIYAVLALFVVFVAWLYHRQFGSSRRSKKRRQPVSPSK